MWAAAVAMHAHWLTCASAGSLEGERALPRGQPASGQARAQVHRGARPGGPFDLVADASCAVDAEGHRHCGPSASAWWRWPAGGVDPFLTDRHTQDHYPCSVNKVVVINAPWLFTTVWSFIKPFMYESTKRTVTILSGDYKEELFNIIDPSELPACYGGTVSTESGQPVVTSADAPETDFTRTIDGYIASRAAAAAAAPAAGAEGN